MLQALDLQNLPLNMSNPTLIYKEGQKEVSSKHSIPSSLSHFPFLFSPQNTRVPPNTCMNPLTHNPQHSSKEDFLWFSVTWNGLLDYGLWWVSLYAAGTGFCVWKRRTVIGWSRRRRRRRGKFLEGTKVGLCLERPLSSLLVATPPTRSASWKSASPCKTLVFLSVNFAAFSYFCFSAFSHSFSYTMFHSPRGWWHACSHPTQFFFFFSLWDGWSITSLMNISDKNYQWSIYNRYICLWFPIRYISIHTRICW